MGAYVLLTVFLFQRGASESKDPETVTDSLLELKDDVTSEIDHYLGVVPSMANRKEYLVFLAASLLLSLGILLLLGYIYLWPLRPGRHTIHWVATSCAGGPDVQDITYELTIR